jgi:hypothetical protein
MKAIIFTFALISSALSQTNPMEQFLGKVRETVDSINLKSCKGILSEQQQDCMNYSNEMSSKLISDFRPIVKNELDKMISNADGNYYKQDPKTKRWYRLKKGSKKSAKDGIKENAKILTKVLDFRFKELVNPQSDRRLRKRFGFGWLKSFSLGSSKKLSSSFSSGSSTASSVNRGRSLSPPKIPKLNQLSSQSAPKINLGIAYKSTLKRYLGHPILAVGIASVAVAYVSLMVYWVMTMIQKK